MPQERTLGRIDKLTKLVAVFDQFHDGIARLDDPTAKRLVENWARIRHQYLQPTGAPSNRETRHAVACPAAVQWLARTPECPKQ